MITPFQVGLATAYQVYEGRLQTYQLKGYTLDQCREFVAGERAAADVGVVPSFPVYPSITNAAKEAN